MVAVFAGAIADLAAGMGQELFNAGVLLAAAVMLGWHNIWMSRHGRELAAAAGALGAEVASGRRQLSAVTLVIGVAVLREGAETVLLIYGIAAGVDADRMQLLTGGAVGLAGAIAFGYALYRGLVHIPTRHLFSVTNLLILMLAAGMAADACGYLVQADIVPPLGLAIWDTSAILSEASIAGRVLHTLIGYVEQPSGIQVLAYVAVVLIITGLTRLLGGAGEGAESASTSTSVSHRPRPTTP
jgi:high-affinity iron transporter